MLLVCPSCRTRYVVPDSAIGVEGRQVRCANCKHSWHQDGVILPPPPAPFVVAPPVFAPTHPAPVAEATSSPLPKDTTEDSAPAAKLPDQPVPPSFARFEEPSSDEAETKRDIPESYAAGNSYFEDTPQQSHFAHEPPFRPRRNPAKLWTMAAVVFALFIAAAGGAAWYFGVPDVGANLGIVRSEPDLTIVLNENLELNEREDGTPYFIASGSIVNPTSTAQTVPEMLVTLKDAGGRPVYSWKMKAKVRTLAPGDKVDFSEARLDVPQAASQISIGWVI
jgi:predicted Zn finger-like uncharacterized protein